MTRVKTCQGHGDAGPGDLLKMEQGVLEEDGTGPGSLWPSGENGGV